MSEKEEGRRSAAFSVLNKNVDLNFGPLLFCASAAGVAAPLRRTARAAALPARRTGGPFAGSAVRSALRTFRASARSGAGARVRTSTGAAAAELVFGIRVGAAGASFIGAHSGRTVGGRSASLISLCASGFGGRVIRTLCGAAKSGSGTEDHHREGQHHGQKQLKFFHPSPPV